MRKGGDHVTVDDMWIFSPATRQWTRREVSAPVRVRSAGMRHVACGATAR